MKFPSLGRVLSIVIIILSLALIGVGVAGIDSAKNDKQTDEKKVALIESRLSTYEEYKGLLKDKETYADALEEYEKLKAEYDADHAEHKTDLAIYTATEGGIAQAKIELPKAEAQIKDAFDQANAKLADFNNHGATYNEVVNQALAKMRETDQYKEAMQGLDTINSQITFFNTFISAKAALGSEWNDKDAQNTKITTLTTAVETAKSEEIAAKQAYDVIPDDEEHKAEKEAAKQAWDAAIANVTAAETALGNYLTLVGIIDAAASVPGFPISDDTAIQSGLAELNGKKSYVEGQIQQGEAQAIQTACQIFNQEINAAINKIIDAYTQLCGTGLEVTYKEWGLPKEQEKLLERKIDLDKRAKELAEMDKKNEQLKQNEKRLTSSKILLESNTQIKQSIDNGMELEQAAKNEIERYTQELNFMYDARIKICCMLLAAAFFGILELFASFEIIKSQFLRILFLVLFILLCAGAEALSVYVGRDNMYSAITAAVIGLLSLIFIAPNVKKRPLKVEAEPETI